jgi:hypothetical protein
MTNTGNVRTGGLIQMQALRMTPRRKRPSLKERTTPCQVCNHPLSQRHHMMPFKDYGEQDWVAYLCANCHELWHIMYLAEIKRSPYAERLLNTIIPDLTRGDTPEDRAFNRQRLYSLLHHVQASYKVQAKVKSEMAEKLLRDEGR